MTQVVSAALGYADTCFDKGKLLFPTAEPVFDIFSNVARIIKCTIELKATEALKECGKLKNNAEKLATDENVARTYQKVKDFLSEREFSALSIGGDKSHELYDNFDELSEKMEELIELVKENFDSAKSFIVEHEFTTNIVVTVDILMNFMQDVIEKKTEESESSFLAYCAKNDHIELVMTIKHRLVHNVSNPLYAAMEADPRRSLNTFKTWKKCIHNLLTSLCITYAFKEGLAGRTATSSGRIYELVLQTKEVLDNFIDEYDNEYWPDCVERIMRETADENEDRSLSTTADILFDALNEIHTNDRFLVLVYCDADGDDSQFKADSDDVIYQFDRGLCSMVVYRYSADHDLDDVEEMWDRVKQKLEEPIYNNPKDGMHDAVAEIYDSIDECGFIGVIKGSRDALEFRADEDEDGDGLVLVMDARCVSRASDKLFSLFENDKLEDVVVFVAPH